MPQITRVIDDLSERYSQLRGLERRSDEMLKQVIDRFYVVEGLNRLQTELDCLDMLVKHKANTSRADTAAVSSRANLNSNISLNKSHSTMSMFKNIYSRSKRATKSAISLIKHSVKGRDSNDENKISSSSLSKITTLQRNKLSELMTIVKGSIVTNYGVLEQLQLLYEMHDKNMALWQNIRQLASTIMPTAPAALRNGSELQLETTQAEAAEQDAPNEIVKAVEVLNAIAIEEQKCEIDEVIMGEPIIVGKVSNTSLKHIEHMTHNVNSKSSKSSITSVTEEALNADENAEQSASDDNENAAAVDSDDGDDVADVTIGDGQSVLVSNSNLNAMTQTLTDAKSTNLSQPVVPNALAAEKDAPKNFSSNKKNLKTSFA